MLISREDARIIGRCAWDATAEAMKDDDKGRIKVAVAFTEVFCEVLIAQFPEMAADGENILDKIGRAVMSYPPETPFVKKQSGEVQ